MSLLQHPHYNVANDGVFVDDGTDSASKAIADATRALNRRMYDGEPEPLITVVVSESATGDPRHTTKALQAYERIRSILMLGYRSETDLRKYDDQDAYFDFRLADLLTDIRHFCDVEGMELGNLDRQAHLHYLTQREAVQ